MESANGCVMNSKKAQLALNILEDHFGKKTSLVARYLLTHERNTLQEIAQYFARNPPSPSSGVEKLKLSSIKEVLLVLLQHQCLLMTRPYTASGALSGDDPSELYSGLEYGINLDAILYRLRFSHLLEICGKYYGDIAVNIMEELIHHGRLPMRCVLDNIMKKLELTGADEYTTQDDIISIFEKLIQRRFIIPVQSLDVAVIRPLPPIPGSDLLDGLEKAPSSVKKRKSTDSTPLKNENSKKSRSTTPSSTPVSIPNTADELLPLEIRLMMQKQQNPGADASSTSSSSLTASNGAVAVSKRGGRGGGRGRGRGKREEDQSHDHSLLLETSSKSIESNLGPRESVLWTIGWEQLDREERHQLCINVAHQRMGTLAGNIVKIILDRSMPTEMGAKQSHSSPISLLELCAILRESRVSPGGQSGVDIQTIRQVMDLMRCDALGMVDKTTGVSTNTHGNSDSHNKDSGTQYTINISAICRAVAGRLMRNIAEEKFGKESARIVELLQKHKYLEQQKLSEMLILPAREGRERLYDLFKNHWVEYLEISKRGDYNSSSTSFFWNLDRTKLQPQLLEGMYGAILNLRLRKRMEVETGKDLLDFSHTITDREEKQKYQKLCLALNRLDNSIMKVIENTLVLGAWS